MKLSLIEKSKFNKNPTKKNYVKLKICLQYEHTYGIINAKNHEKRTLLK